MYIYIYIYYIYKHMYYIYNMHYIAIYTLTETKLHTCLHSHILIHIHTYIYKYIYRKQINFVSPFYVQLSTTLWLQSYSRESVLIQ